MIDTIVFDMGGVLIDFSAQLFTERLQEKNQSLPKNLGPWI